MILQKCVINRKYIDCKDMYYRGDYQIVGDGVFVEKGNDVTTDTYMNIFDYSIYQKYTLVADVYFEITYRGNANIALVYEKEDGETKELKVSGRTAVPRDWTDGIIYFRFQALDDSVITGASFGTITEPRKVVNLSSIICTFKRERNLFELIDIIKKSDHKIHIYVIDNAKSIKGHNDEYVHIYPNTNCGGSGGFSKGMDKIIDNHNLNKSDYVILMDDDVLTDAEMFNRLVAFLSFIKREYRNKYIAGRMLNILKPWIQYTSCEKWNGGTIEHINHNMDLSDRKNLFCVNNSIGGEYSGWWLACYPYSVIQKHRPLPFFLHCDDVEFGLRLKDSPIILNGVHVWHKIPDDKGENYFNYYDMRNAMIVNSIYNPSDFRGQYEFFKSKIGPLHAARNYTGEYLAILGMNDYLRGKSRFLKTDSEKHHNRIMRISARKHSRYINMLLWRITAVKLRLKCNHISYDL